ncbi:MAG: GGDEF domain-containing protein [Xanthomonadales bacterium]|nr:GGDEF domain-containing protein [Xanthomonadales bacterium]
MKAHLKQLIFKPINYYVLGVLMVAACYALFMLHGIFSMPQLLTWLIGTSAMLLVWQYGIKMPYLGMISMERLVQFHLLLTLPISETLVITTTASLIMPFINKSYRMNSYHIATIRALNNLSMNTIMLLSTYWVLSHWLTLPLLTLDFWAVFVITIAAIMMQIINIVMIYIYFSFDRKKVSKLFTPAYLFADFIYVPAGVLSALLWHGDHMVFSLFSSFMVVLLISFYGFNHKSNNEDMTIPKAGTEYPASFLEVDQVTAAIKARCDQLFDVQALCLLELNAAGLPKRYLLKDERFSKDEFEEILEQTHSKEHVNLGRLFIQGKTIDYMTALFKDHSGVFARLLLVRTNHNAFLISDLNLLRLFVQRYRPGLSYALTFSALSEYKNNLEQKVKERTLQLEQVNQEKSELVNKLKLISNSDALTQLYNRRYFNALVKHHKTKPPQQLTLAIIDIDHFKNINDNFGHEKGDQVIQHVAKIMRSWADKNVTLIRYGGEEFAILVKNQPRDATVVSLSKLLVAVRSYDWQQLDLTNTLTISIGMAHYPDSTLDELFDHADSAMYQAKTNGRNQLKSFHG